MGGYGILRVEKIKLSDGGGIHGRAMHDFREFDNVAKVFDRAMTRQNEYIGCQNTAELKQRAEERWSTLTKSRSDSVGMLEVMVTTTANSLQKNDEKQFFQDVWNEVASWYGEENVLTMAIHRDETTPHCHIFLTPIETKEVKKTRSSRAEQLLHDDTKTVTQLNAKRLLNGRESLSQLQDDFHAHVFSKYGLDRGEKEPEIKKKNVRSSLRAKEIQLKEREEVLEQKIQEVNSLYKDMILNYTRTAKQIDTDHRKAKIEPPRRHESAEHYLKRVVQPNVDAWARGYSKLQNEVKQAEQKGYDRGWYARGRSDMAIEEYERQQKLQEEQLQAERQQKLEQALQKPLIEPTGPKKKRREIEFD